MGRNWLMERGMAWWGAGAYCLGLLMVSLVVRHGGLTVGLAVPVTVGLIALGSLLAALTLPRYWSGGPGVGLWLAVGAIAILAIGNYGWRYPTPSAQDISRQLSRPEAAIGQEVWGQVEAMPRLSRNGKGQIWLRSQLARPLDGQGIPLGPPQAVQGKLYVTLPAAAIVDLHPGQTLKVQGRLYAPSPPKNPYGFNLPQYLASQGCYAGLSARRIQLAADGPRWGLWRLRQRIASAHAMGLGERAGPLVSAMALDRRAVNVPYDLQDSFIQAGLAHTLAASGFHVSLLLGVVLGIMGHPAIVKRCSHPGWSKLGVGSVTLGLYVLMTGGQPSIMRAAVMGLAALVGLALERQVRPLGSLLLAVTFLLLWQPGWIEDIGFRLSAMATLGLMLGVSPLTRWLQWLPPTLATAIAVPLVAYFWTIPLSLFHFNTLTTYSLLLNMIVTPLVTVISLGGIFSGLVALLSPGLGAMVAWLLWLPTHLLIALVEWEIRLPGSALATGQISLAQLLGLYSLYAMGCQAWSRRHRAVLSLAMVLVAFGPLWYRSATLTEVTVLAAGNDPVMVLQDHQSSLLVNSGTDRTGFYTVLPFLRQAGINRLDYGIAAGHSDPENWRTITQKTPVGQIYQVGTRSVADLSESQRLPLHQSQTLGRQQVTALASPATALQFTFWGNHSWLLLSGLNPSQQEQILTTPTTLASEVLWWDGSALSPSLLAAVQPRVAIAATRQLSTELEQTLQSRGIQVFCPERDGAISWHPQRGYQAYLAHQFPASQPLD